MAHVKMNVGHECEFIANFKVVQSGFKGQGIETPILIERFVKCKTQNLELFQWVKHATSRPKNDGNGKVVFVGLNQSIPSFSPAPLSPAQNNAHHPYSQAELSRMTD
ncbi:hypothetical protein OF83DRAFT_1179976 [Amylostereum chailletii]|nr:hypothetical protein OF83DRAFT_1179976 [Amylostereum chailletii]